MKIRQKLSHNYQISSNTHLTPSSDCEWLEEMQNDIPIVLWLCFSPIFSFCSLNSLFSFQWIFSSPELKAHR